MDLTVADRAEVGDVEFLKDRLYDYNVARTGIADGRGVAIFVRDRQGAIVAGLHGWTWGDVLDIRELWVREDARGRGLGQRLLLAAERAAAGRGCHRATLETQSFQAPAFYAKFGYQVFGTLENYPRGHQKHYLRKDLA
ncbi:MAG TPA: GNAT family N-acetyltransferase [Methylomirabilota bacterium]|jgi:GNAT superfamily N-acetyltransferase|nr:GNAT family N-acetyltransferase [Methylomirabilota bacterium]